MKKNLIEHITAWIDREFNPLHRDDVLADMIDVMSGNRAGNSFENKAAQYLMESYNNKKDI